MKNKKQEELFIKIIEAVTKEKVVSELRSTTFFYHPDEASTTSYEFMWDYDEELSGFTKEEKDSFAEYLTHLKGIFLSEFCRVYYQCEEDELNNEFIKDEELYEKNVTEFTFKNIETSLPTKEE